MKVVDKKNIKKPGKRVLKQKRDYKKYQWPALIIVITLIAYWSSFSNEFTNWDDMQYVVDNPDVHSLSISHIISHFSHFYMGHYHPLTMISLSFNYLLGADKPFIFIFTNVLLHIVNTLLVFYLIRLLTKNLNIALISALLFGVHPLHVESVSWISERKDVLYGFFYLFSLYHYVLYVQKQKRKSLWYSYILFLCALLSKAQAVTLAGAVILVDYLEGRKYKGKDIFIEKVPYVLLALIFGYISTLADKTNIFVFGEANYSYLERILLACYGFTHYIFKLIYPSGLSAWYPYPYKAGTPMPAYLWIYLAAPVFVLFLLSVSYKINKLVTFGILFFIVTIFTMLQIFPIRDAVYADRYVYLPSIGFFLLLGIGYNYIAEHRKSYFQTLKFITIICVIVLTILTNSRASVWKDSVTLWEDTNNKYPNIPLVLVNLGKGIYDHNSEDGQKALIYYNRAIELKPRFSAAYNNRGFIKDNMGDYKGAIDDYTHAIAIDSNNLLAYNNRAMAKNDLNDSTGAFRDINKLILKAPKEAAYYRNRGLIYMKLKHYETAIRDFSHAILLDPSLHLAYLERGYSKHFLGNYMGAIKDYTFAIKIKPDYDEAYFDRAAAEMKVSQEQHACKDLLKASDLGNKNAMNNYEQHCK